MASKNDGVVKVGIVPVRAEYEGANPFVGLLRSRKFWVAVLALLQAIVLQYFDVPDAIWQAFMGVAAVVIAAIAVEDAAEKRAEGQSFAPLPLTQSFAGQLSPIERKQLRRELLDELIELWGEEEADGDTKPGGGGTNGSRPHHQS